MLMKYSKATRVIDSFPNYGYQMQVYGTVRVSTSVASNDRRIEDEVDEVFLSVL